MTPWCRPSPVVAALALALTATTAGAEGYLLQKGDRVALAVIGVAELQQTMTVDVDGNVIVPLVGPVPATGRTLATLSADVRNALAQASYTALSSAGELLTLQIPPGTVSVSMADYRPVYVDGDVQSAGAFPYAPGLTARRAITLAGGYGLARLRGSDPVPELLNLEGQRSRLLAERAATEARVGRVQAQLNDAEGSEAVALATDPAAGPVGEALAAAEQQRLDASRVRDREVAKHYASAIAKTEGQIATLEERMKGEMEGVAADTADFQRLLDAQAKGTVSVARLSDGRRTLLFSTTRELETKSALDRAQMDLETLTHERARTSIDDRAGRLAELGEATLALAAIKAALAATERQILYYQGVVTDPEIAADAAIRIDHPDGTSDDLAAGEDPMLSPGDLVTVRMALPVMAD